MFNHCVWYSIHKSHSLSKLIINLAKTFHTDLFHAHITIVSNKAYKEADHIYKHQCIIPKPWFRIHGRIYQTKTHIGNNIFYAIQQDYYMYDIRNLGDYHVSLAYRINKPFTKEEIAYANGLVPVDTIWSNDFKVSLNDCRPSLPKNWKQLKVSVF